MDRPAIHQVPDGGAEQGKMEETGYEIIFGAPTTFAVKGLMMMMMMKCFAPKRINECLEYFLFECI